jgi:hypothetical protein
MLDEKSEKRKLFASCRAKSLKVSLSSVELSEQPPLKKQEVISKKGRRFFPRLQNER